MVYSIVSSWIRRRQCAKKPGNSLLYLLIIVTVMAMSLTGIIQILRPLQTFSSMTSDKRMLMEQLAQQHIRKIKLHIEQNPSTYLNLSNYDAPVTGNAQSPDYQILNNATWGTVSGAIATTTSTTPDVPATWRLNDTDLTATSTLTRDNLRRLTEGSYAGTIQVAVTVTAGSMTTTYRQRITMSPDYCGDVATPVAETWTVPYAAAAVPGTETFEVGTRQSNFIEFPGYRNICWQPTSASGGGALNCVYNGNRAAVRGAGFTTGMNYLLQAYATYYSTLPGTPVQSWSMVSLENANAASANRDTFIVRYFPVEGFPMAYEGVIPMDMTEMGGCSAPPCYNNPVTAAAPIGNVQNTFKPTNVGVLSMPSDSRSTNDMNRALLFYFDRSDTTKYYLRAMHLTWSVAGWTIPYMYYSGSTNDTNGPSGYSGIGEYVVANGYDPSGAMGGFARIFTVNDKIGISGSSNAIVVTDGTTGKVYGNRILNPTNGTAPMRMERMDNNWFVSDGTPLGSPITFGQPVLDMYGDFAVIPALSGGTIKMMAFRLTDNNDLKIDATNNMLSCGTPVNFDTLMTFDQTVSGTAYAAAQNVRNGISMGTLANIYTWYDPHLKRFSWMVRGATENSMTIYSWDPELWGIMQNTGGTCPAATSYNWVEAATTGVITEIRNVRYRGIKASSTPTSATSQSGYRWAGKHGTVEFTPQGTAGTTLWPATGDATLAFLTQRRPYQTKTLVRGGDGGGVILSQEKANFATMFTGRPKGRIFANIPGLAWTFRIEGASNRVLLDRMAVQSPYGMGNTYYISGTEPTLTDVPSDGEGNLVYSMRNGTLYVTDEDFPKAGPSFNYRAIHPMCYYSGRKKLTHEMPGFIPPPGFLPNAAAIDLMETNEQGQYGRYE